MSPRCGREGYRPFHGLEPVCTGRTWGSRPRLYARACFAGWQTEIARLESKVSISPPEIRNGDTRMREVMSSIKFNRTKPVSIFLGVLLVVFSVTSASAQAMQASYADLVTKVSPAVVTIRSTERARQAQQFPFQDDPSFREFFGDRLPQQTPRRVQGVGSGVIVNPDGFILTNHHVVDGALEIKVETTDNHTYTAKLVGSDPASDLAVLKIEGPGPADNPTGQFRQSARRRRRARDR